MNRGDGEEFICHQQINLEDNESRVCRSYYDEWQNSLHHREDAPPLRQAAFDVELAHHAPMLALVCGLALVVCLAFVFREQLVLIHLRCANVFRGYLEYLGDEGLDLASCCTDACVGKDSSDTEFEPLKEAGRGVGDTGDRGEPRGTSARFRDQLADRDAPLQSPQGGVDRQGASQVASAQRHEDRPSGDAHLYSSSGSRPSAPGVDPPQLAVAGAQAAPTRAQVRPVSAHVAPARVQSQSEDLATRVPFPGAMFQTGVPHSGSAGQSRRTFQA